MCGYSVIRWCCLIATLGTAAATKTLTASFGTTVNEADQSDGQRLDGHSMTALENIRKYILQNIAVPSYNYSDAEHKLHTMQREQLFNQENFAEDVNAIDPKEADRHSSLGGTVHPSPGGMTHSSRTKRQSSSVGGLEGVLSQLFNIPEELHMLTPGLVRRYDYPFEEHFVSTPDGYILGLHRIPGPRFTKKDQLPSFNAKVVLLTHCAACASSDFVMGKPGLSLGFLLADAGYDVWMANYRGNTYSRNHTSLDPDRDAQFWHFSLDEIAFYDLPTTVHYVRNTTRVDKIFYIGHSLGTLAFYMSASTRNSMVDKVRLMVGMAPTAFRDNVSGPMAIGMQLANIFRGLLEVSSTGEMMARTPLVYTALYLLCNGQSVFSDTCVTLLTAVGGGVNEGFFQKEETPFILAHFPAGISVRALAHVGQLITSNGMQQFDYGPAINEQKYGSPDPPRYSLDAVTCPTALYWTKNDYLSAPKDVARLAAALPNLVFSREVAEPDFNHMDFLLADSARSLVYDSILKLMEIF